MLIYLHGLNSSSLSYKAGVLRERLFPVTVVSPSYPAHRPEAAVEQLTHQLRELASEGPLAVIGSSMGGFYGQFLARRFSVEHLFMINPALQPWTLLPQFEGQTLTTAAGETYRVTKELVERTRAYEVADPCDGVPTTLFLDTGDEVIDYRIAESIYRDCGRLFVYQGGDHAFQHLDEAIVVIRDQLVGSTSRADEGG
jgi:predicted esterase YcpF (UPF0227 family)